MRLILLNWSLFCLLSFGLARAQQNLPPVVSPDDIFTDAIEVIDTSRILNADDSTRSFYYFDPTANEWRAYAYPEEVGLVDSEYALRHRSDGTYVFSLHTFWMINTNRSEDIWILDPSTGEFSHPEIACGRLRALAGEGEWIIFENSETAQSHLCFTETGEMSPPIPVETQDALCTNQFEKPIVISPDARWVLFFCGEISFTAYSYEIETQEFLYLGASDNDHNQYVEIARWLSDTEVIIHAYPTWNPPSNNYYIIDVSQVEGLTFAAWDMYRAPFYYDDPPHLEWVPCEFGNCGRLREEGLHYYDFITRELTVYPYVPRIHGVSLVIPDRSGDRLYRALDMGENFDIYHEPAPSATLIRFNYDTGTYSELFTGEIEWIRGFSPDGRYVVLHMGDNGEVFSSSVLAENQLGYVPVGNARIVIFDLIRNIVVYEANGSEWIQYSGDPLWMYWINENTFIIEGVRREDSYLTYQISLENGQIHETLIEGTILRVSPDYQRLLLQDEIGTMSIYIIATGQTIPIIQAFDHSLYSLSSEWHSEDVLTVVLSSVTTTTYPVIALWHIRVP